MRTVIVSGPDNTFIQSSHRYTLLRKLIILFFLYIRPVLIQLSHASFPSVPHPNIPPYSYEKHIVVIVVARLGCRSLADITLRKRG